MNDTPEDLLREARTLIRDGLLKGYPADELHTDPENLIERITGLLADDYDIDSGEPG